jgi:hypothetical protein
MSHDFTVVLDTEHFEIRISEGTEYGYFEHNELGDECGGGLWFTGDELVDYDGVFALPKEVVDALRDYGFKLDEAYD